MRRYLSLIRRAWRAYRKRRCRDIAAAMAMHLAALVLSLTITVAWIVGVLDVEADRLSTEIYALVGHNAGSVFDSLIAHASTDWRSWLPVLAVALIAVWNVATLIRFVQETINAALGVEVEDGHQNWGRIILKRVAGSVFVGFVATGLLLSFSAKTALEVLDRLGIDPVAASPWAFRVVEVIVALVLAGILFAGMFGWLADAKAELRLIWHGAFWAAKLYTLVQIVAAFAIVYVGGLSFYGAATVMLVGIAYLYFASASFLWGAQVLGIDVEDHAVQPEPSSWAVARTRRDAHERAPEAGPEPAWAVHAGP